MFHVQQKPCRCLLRFLNVLAVVLAAMLAVPAIALGYLNLWLGVLYIAFVLLSSFFYRVYKDNDYILEKERNRRPRSPSLNMLLLPEDS